MLVYAEIIEARSTNFRPASGGVITSRHIWQSDQLGDGDSLIQIIRTMQLKRCPAKDWTPKYHMTRPPIISHRT